MLVDSSLSLSSCSVALLPVQFLLLYLPACALIEIQMRKSKEEENGGKRERERERERESKSSRVTGKLEARNWKSRLERIKRTQVNDRTKASFALDGEEYLPFLLFIGMQEEKRERERSNEIGQASLTDGKIKSHQFS